MGAVRATGEGARASVESCLRSVTGDDGSLIMVCGRIRLIYGRMRVLTPSRPRARTRDCMVLCLHGRRPAA